MCSGRLYDRLCVYAADVSKRHSVSVSDPDKTTDSKKVTSTSTTKDTNKVTSDKYEKFKSSWLDNQLKQYEKDGSKTTAADTSVSIDTTT